VQPRQNPKSPTHVNFICSGWETPVPHMDTARTVFLFPTRLGGSVPGPGPPKGGGPFRGKRFVHRGFLGKNGVCPGESFKAPAPLGAAQGVGKAPKKKGGDEAEGGGNPLPDDWGDGGKGPGVSVCRCESGGARGGGPKLPFRPVRRFIWGTFLVGVAW